MTRQAAGMNTLLTPCCVLEPQVEAHAPAAGLRRKEARVSPDGREQWLNWVVRRTPGGALAGRGRLKGRG